jgi:hypothetical protein
MPDPTPIGTAKTRPVIQPAATAELPPTQAATVYWIEWKNSRQIKIDLQRGLTQHIYIFAGTPDQVAKNAAIGGLREGYPHPWEKDTYLTELRFEHHIHGPDLETSTATPGTARESSAYTKVTVTYRQIPCPGRWEEDESSALTSRLEWFDRTDPPRSLKGTREGVPILIPVPVYKRHFPKVFLTPANWAVINGEEGKINLNPWRGRPGGFWQFTGKRSRLLFGKPETRAAYELTLMFRGDPERHHDWWWPVIDPETMLPKQPGRIAPRTRRQAFLDDGIFTMRHIYDRSELDWDTMVPLRGTPCDPPQP